MSIAYLQPEDWANLFEDQIAFHLHLHGNRCLFMKGAIYTTEKCLISTEDYSIWWIYSLKKAVINKFPVFWPTVTPLWALVLSPGRTCGAPLVLSSELKSGHFTRKTRTKLGVVTPDQLASKLIILAQGSKHVSSHSSFLDRRHCCTKFCLPCSWNCKPCCYPWFVCHAKTSNQQCSLRLAPWS